MRKKSSAWRCLMEPSAMLRSGLARWLFCYNARLTTVPPGSKSGAVIIPEPHQQPAERLVGAGLTTE
jgi:hypothetical protein